MNTVEEAMLEHYKFIIDAKDKELAELYRAIRYKEQELTQLKETLDDMTVILSNGL